MLVRISPSRADVPTVWAQSQRPLAQWDGSIRNPLLRNLAASLAIVGAPDLLDVELSHRMVGFLGELPSAPYPFDLDRAQIVRRRTRLGSRGG